MPHSADSLSEPSLWAFALAAVIGGVVLAANPKRKINRYFAGMSACVATWQLLTFLALVFERDALARSAVSASGTLILSLALWLNAVVHPLDSLRRSMRRQSFFFSMALAAVLIPWLPRTVLDVRVGGFLLLESTQLFIFTASVGLLLVRAQRALDSIPPSRRFELANFRLLVSLALVFVCVALVSRYAFDSTLWVGSAAVLVYYLWTARMMTNPNIYDAGHTVRVGASVALPVVVSAAALYAFFWLLQVLEFPFTTEHFFYLSLLTAAALYPIIMFTRAAAAAVFPALYTPAESSLRSDAVRLMSQASNEAAFVNAFRALLSRFFQSDRVHIWLLNSSEPSPDLQKLATYAAGTGWITPESAARSMSDEQLARVTELFDTLDLGGVMMAQVEYVTVVITVGKRAHGARVVTWPEIRFAREMAVFYGAAIIRLRASEKAMHTNRLALIGYVAIQRRHEGRNRLESIIALLEMLDAGLESDITPQHRRVVLEEARAFAEDHDFFLEMARADRVALLPTPIKRAIEHAVISFGPLAQREGVTIKSDLSEIAESLTVLGDEKLLRQVILNLLRNATHALNGIKDPWISVTASTEPDSHNVCICVRDNGPGVSLDQYDRLFQAFNTARKGGTGLGLSICRDAIGLMGGTITYDSPRGEPHAVFRIRLPLTRQDVGPIRA